MSEEVAMKQLLEYAPAMEEWCRKFMHSEPQEGLGDIEFKRYSVSYVKVFPVQVLLVVVCIIKLHKLIAFRNGDSVTGSCVSVTDVLDIEENVWSPRYVHSMYVCNHSDI